MPVYLNVSSMFGFENPKIKGIEINGSILKIRQLADDTTCFVTDIPSVKEILVMFKCFKLCAGLKINTDNTKANYIGSLKPFDIYIILLSIHSAEQCPP